MVKYVRIFTIAVLAGMLVFSAASFAIAGKGGIHSYKFELTAWERGDPTYDYGQTGRVKLIGMGPNQSCPYEYNLILRAKGLMPGNDYWL